MAVDKKKLSIQILSIIGFALTIKLAMIYYVANYERYALSSFCSISDFIDCDGVARTMQSQFWGIPLAYWGMFFYITVFFLTIVDKFKNFRFLKFLEVFKNPMAYITFLGTIAFIVSMILACTSLFRINKLCILCVATYVLDFIIALVASSGMFKNIVRDFKTTFFDFIDGAKKYTKTFIVLLIASISFLSYSEISFAFVPHLKIPRELVKYRNMKKNPYRVNGNILGNKDGDVVIHLYSDYVCPLCYIHNIMLHKAVREFPNIKIIHHNLPFDKTCNPNIETNMHPYACYMARGAIAARKQGNYWGMSSLLYENQPKKDADLLKLVEKLNLDKDKFMKDFNSQETYKELEQEIARAKQLKLDSTPTMYVNGNEIVGVTPYEKLKENLIKYGAKQKRIFE